MDLKEKIQSFWNKKPCGTFGDLPNKYDKGYFERIRKRRYALEPFIFQITNFNTSKGKKVLEIGCGIGNDGIEFAKAGAIYTGIDLSSKSVELCKENFSFENLTGDIINVDGENLPFEDNTFDIIYSWGVIHHAPSMENVIKEIYRVLKPGGRITIMIYNRYSLVGLQLYILHGLLKLKPFAKWDNLFYNYHESIGTRALTNAEAKKMFYSFKNLELFNVVTPYDLRLSRNVFMPKIFAKLVPSCFGFFKILKGKK